MKKCINFLCAQIMGDTRVARKALIGVLGRLRNNASRSEPVRGGDREVHDGGRSSSSRQSDSYRLRSSSSFGRHSISDMGVS